MSHQSTPFHVIGLSIVTSNEEAFQKHSIAKLWEAFSKAALSEKLNQPSPNVYAVYSDYENDHHGKYRITVGHAVNAIDAVPEGLFAVTVPEGKYQEFVCKSHDPAEIVATWKTVWENKGNAIHRSYAVDFEEYSKEGMTLYISHED